MTQIVLTALIVLTAFILTIFRLVRFFKNPLKGCTGCEQHGKGCSLEDLKNEFDLKKKISL